MAKISEFVISELHKPEAVVALAHGVAGMPLPIRAMGPSAMSPTPAPLTYDSASQCMLFFSRFPQVRANLELMAPVSDEWRRLVNIWVQLQRLVEAANAAETNTLLEQVRAGSIGNKVPGRFTALAVIVPNVVGLLTRRVSSNSAEMILTDAGFTHTVQDFSPILVEGTTTTYRFEGYNGTVEISKDDGADYYNRVYGRVFAQTPAADSESTGSAVALFCIGD